MNCPRCKGHVFIGQYRCDCGHLLAQEEGPTIQSQLAKMGLARKKGESTKDHAARCRKYLRENGFHRILPKQAQQEIDKEAIEERKAIQEESCPKN